MGAPTVGRLVDYTLSDHDVEAIQRRRADLGLVGNAANAGEVYPAVVVRVWEPSVNLQVLLDGEDSYWATSRVEGDEPGMWAWPLGV
jgi:hypothetical protein